jgi:glycosyltransferase involved in cell wall biosynthesis
MTLPTIAVAMATYNGERYIEEQLESLAQQTRLPDELVVADDASVDNTRALVANFAKNSPFPVRLHTNERQLGFRNNFMNAANHCKSTFIAFCDQDDIWDMNKISDILPIFDDPTVLLVYHNATIFDVINHRTQRIYKNLPAINFCEPLVSDPWAVTLGFTQVFRGSLLKWSSLREASIDPHKPLEPMAHDQWVPFLASIFGRTVCLSRCLVDYRQHSNNVFGWHGGHRISTAVRNLSRQDIIISNLANAAKNRADILKLFLPLAFDSEKVLIENGISYYLERSMNLSQRYKIYTHRRLYSRLRACYTAWKRETYSKNHFHINREMLKDICGMFIHQNIRKQFRGWPGVATLS